MLKSWLRALSEISPSTPDHHNLRSFEGNAQINFTILKATQLYTLLLSFILIRIMTCHILMHVLKCFTT